MASHTSLKKRGSQPSRSMHKLKLELEFDHENFIECLEIMARMRKTTQGRLAAQLIQSMISSYEADAEEGVFVANKLKNLEVYCGCP